MPSHFRSRTPATEPPIIDEDEAPIDEDEEIPWPEYPTPGNSPTHEDRLNSEALRNGDYIVSGCGRRL